MWQSVARADIERTLRQLQSRRAEAICRHTREISALDSQSSQIESLREQADRFFRKFGYALVPPPAREPPAGAGSAFSPGVRTEEQSRPRTNFEVFLRASTSGRF